MNKMFLAKSKAEKLIKMKKTTKREQKFSYIFFFWDVMWLIEDDNEEKGILVWKVNVFLFCIFKFPNGNA